MYIKRSVLAMLTAFTGVAVLLVLTVLFCFTQTQIPTAVYAAGWFGCLGAMLVVVTKIYR